MGTRAPMLALLRPNERWSLDFISDQFTDGRRFRVLAIVDDCTRENLALVADTSLSGVRVGRELDRLMSERRWPKMIVGDNGSEFTSNAIPVGAGVILHRNAVCNFPSSTRRRRAGARPGTAIGETTTEALRSANTTWILFNVMSGISVQSTRIAPHAPRYAPIDNSYRAPSNRPYPFSRSPARHRIAFAAFTPK